MNTKTIYGAIAITFIVAVLALFFPKLGTNVAPGPVGAAATSTTTHFPSLSMNNLVVGETCDTDYGTCNGVTTHVISGSCNTATSTLFSVKSPYNATSTVTFAEIYGTTAATTTDIVVGTSTTPALALTAATTTMKSQFMGMGSIGTSTAFYMSSTALATQGRVTILSGADGATYTNNTSMVVGPNDFVIGFATSTYVGGTTGTGGAQTAAVLPAPTACTYAVQFQR